MSLTKEQKKWFKETLEKKMKIKIINVANTKKAKANAVIKDSDIMNEIIHTYEVDFEVKFTEDLKKDMQSFFRETIKEYFPREK